MLVLTVKYHGSSICHGVSRRDGETRLTVSRDLHDPYCTSAANNTEAVPYVLRCRSFETRVVPKTLTGSWLVFEPPPHSSSNIFFFERTGEQQTTKTNKQHH